MKLIRTGGWVRRVHRRPFWRRRVRLFRRPTVNSVARQVERGFRGRHVAGR